MTIWRMSFHVGNGGYDMFPSCLRVGVAAITYEPLAKIDLTEFGELRKPKAWSQLAPNQKSSLGHVAFHMQAGDTIYVKDHQQIINRGTVLGRPGERAYRFDPSFSIIDPNGVPWAHHVPVDWHSDFEPVRLLLNAEMTTVLKLNSDRIALLRNATRKKLDRASIESIERVLSEQGYHRETKASLKFIAAKHNMVSNMLRGWLRDGFAIRAEQERNRLDLHFSWAGETVLAEIKICFGMRARHGIREALGQLFEYNHYPARTMFDRWLIVLDCKPSDDDRAYIGALRDKWRVPLHLGWTEDGSRFSFYPAWPLARLEAVQA